MQASRNADEEVRRRTDRPRTSVETSPEPRLSRSDLRHPGTGTQRTHDQPIGRLRSALEACLSTIRVIAFWAGAVLPAVYLPLLATASHTSIGLSPALFLIGVHALALVLGRRHAVEDRSLGEETAETAN